MDKNRLLVRAGIVAAICLSGCCPKILAENCYVLEKDSTGMVVTLKEKYGPAIQDSCTVLMRCRDEYVTVHRDGQSGRYPVANWAIVTRKDR